MKVTQIIEERKGRPFASFEIVPPLKGSDGAKLVGMVRPLMEFRPPLLNFTAHTDEIEFVPNPDGSFKRVETETYHILEKAGYDQVPTFSAIGGRWYNAKETMEMGRDDIAPERLKGYMSASWWFAYPRYYYGMLHEANLFKVGRDIAYPELAGK